MGKRKRLIKENGVVKDRAISRSVSKKIKPNTKERDLIKYLIEKGEDLSCLTRYQKRIAKRLMSKK